MCCSRYLPAAVLRAFLPVFSQAPDRRRRGSEKGLLGVVLAGHGVGEPGPAVRARVAVTDPALGVDLDAAGRIAEEPVLAGLEILVARPPALGDHLVAVAAAARPLRQGPLPFLLAAGVEMVSHRARVNVAVRNGQAQRPARL